MSSNGETFLSARGAIFGRPNSTDEGGAGRGRDRLQLLLKEQAEVNLEDVKKYDDADDADSGDDLDSSDSDDDSDEDEEALEKELEKIRKEREEARKKKVHIYRFFCA